MFYQIFTIPSVAIVCAVCTFTKSTNLLIKHANYSYIVYDNVEHTNSQLYGMGLESK